MVGLMAEVTMSMEEYNELIRRSGYRGPVQTSKRLAAMEARSKPKRTRAPSAYNKRLGTALKRLNKRARKKDGSYRKGWSAKKVMRMAHKEVKR